VRALPAAVRGDPLKHRPTAFSLFGDLTIHSAYDGNWYWGRPTAEDLRRDMRAISRAVREDFDRR